MCGMDCKGGVQEIYGTECTVLLCKTQRAEGTTDKSSETQYVTC